MLVCGAWLILAFPAPNLEFLAWFGLVPGLLLIARAPTAREGGMRAWWLGAGYLIAALYWMAPEIGPAVLLVGAVIGVLWVPFGIAAQQLLRPPVTWPRALAALVVVPSCWLLTEWLRSWQALGGPWAVFGVTQWQHPAVLALAAVGGVWLISFALVLANVAIVLALEALPRVLPGATTLRPGLAALGVAAALASLGAGPLAFALTPASPAAREATIALVQPGIIGNATERVDASERLTAELSRSGELSGVKPDLIVWGESSTAADLTRPANHAQLARMEALAREDGADLLVNQDTTVPGQGQEKVGVLVSPAGIQGQYIKTRLVPFGEYIPFRQQLGWLTKISKAAASNMIPGTGAHLLYPADRAGRPLPIGVLICFESAFPDMSRVDTDLGAQLIVYQSATSTFQGTWGPDQHASLGAVRAAETGRPAVQAALTGVTAAFDARGRLLAWMGQPEHGVISVRLGLPAVSARTIYDRFGDYVPWSTLAIVILATLVMFANSRGFPGRSAGAGKGDAAQYAGQSVSRLARPQGKANLVYKEARCLRMVFCIYIPRPRRCARTSSGPLPELSGRPSACRGSASRPLRVPCGPSSTGRPCPARPERSRPRWPGGTASVSR
jgi:apolipoprotein N-acyltransferase